MEGIADVDALQTAIEKDNPGVELFVEDRAGYVRIHAPRYLRVTRASLEEAGPGARSALWGQDE